MSSTTMPGSGMTATRIGEARRTFAKVRDSDQIVRAETGEALPRPRPLRDAPSGATGRERLCEDSARPGGREAPAEGGAGAGRALWGPVRCKWTGHGVAKAMAFAKAGEGEGEGEGEGD